MSLYPWISVSESIPGLSDELNYKEYEIDCQTGRTTGHMLNGIDAIKAWAYRALKTQRLKHPIFTWDFGSDLQNFIGQNFSQDLAQSEIQRTIKETLLLHPNITDVTAFSFDLEGSKLRIGCKIVTILGDVEIGLYTENI
ncbi:MAG: DUF2634 domain-containing protein [Clostridiales bacterium]